MRNRSFRESSIELTPPPLLGDHLEVLLSSTAVSKKRPHVAVQQPCNIPPPKLCDSLELLWTQTTIHFKAQGSHNLNLPPPSLSALQLEFVRPISYSIFILLTPGFYAILISFSVFALIIYY